MGTIKGKSNENGSISGKSIFDTGKLIPSHEGTPTEELEKQIAYLLAQVTLLEKIKANKNEIPTKLSELLSDRLHRTVTDEDIERWNNNDADLFYYVNLPETLDISPVTPQEIFNAVENGKFPVAIVLINGSYNIVAFCSVNIYTAEAIIMYNRVLISLRINQDKSITGNETELASMSDIPDVSQFITKQQVNDYAGVIIPDTKNMTPIKTIEYDISSTSYYKFMSVPNVESWDDARGETLFRITVTGETMGTNIIEGIMSLRNNVTPYLILRNSPRFRSFSCY